MDDLTASAGRDAAHVRAGADVDSFVAEHLLDDRCQLGLIARKQPSSPLEERHGDPEAAAALRELHADRAAAEDDETSRRSLELEDRLARDEARVGETLQLRYGWAASGRDQGVARLQPAIADLDRGPPRQPRAAEDQLDAELAEVLGAVVCHRDLLLDRSDSLPDCDEVDVRFDRRDPVAVRRAHVVGDSCRREQRLAWHASRPEAVSPDPGRFDGSHPQAEVSGELGGDDPRGAEPDDDEVVVGLHERRSSAFANETLNARHQMTTVP